MMEALKSLLNDFDPTVLLPDLNNLGRHLVGLLRISLLAAPLILLGLGLLYFFAVPREANYRLGFRCRRGMASEEAWRFTQRLAGLIWSVLGLVLCIIMAILATRFRSMDAEAMASMAVSCLLWELGLVLLSVIGINAAVILLFDRDGTRREKPLIQFKK